MSSADNAIKQGIQSKGLTAPSVTAEDIEANIKECHYFTAFDGIAHHYRGVDNAWFADPVTDRLTFCVLVLRNGFTVTGESACVSPENFNAAEGRKWARENAINKVWPLMGYALKERLFNLEQLRVKAGALKTMPI